MEEASEVTKMAAKTLRFGPLNWHPTDPERTANYVLLRREVDDLIEVACELGLASHAEEAP